MNMSSTEIFYICGIVALLAAFLACIIRSSRNAGLALWCCGMSIGAMYLSLGFELLAIIQWIISTLVGISFIFYAVLFGPKPGKINIRIGFVRFIATLCVCAGLFLLISYCVKDLFLSSELNTAKIGLGELGVDLLKNHIVSLAVIGLTLFVTIVGAGVFSRAERLKK